MGIVEKTTLAALLLGVSAPALAQSDAMSGEGAATAEQIADVSTDASIEAQAETDAAAVLTMDNAADPETDPASFQVDGMPQVVSAPSGPEPVYPPYTGSYDPEDEDERGIWQQMEELEREAIARKDVIRDDSLSGYLQDVLCETVGPERCTGVRIYVLRDASFNAGMYPNGMMIVHSGALLRLRSEAELAFMLGHEFAHFEERHGLQSFKKARAATDIAIFASSFGMIGSLVGLLAISDLFTFSREQEKEADMLSSEFLAASPYTPRASADVWVRMLDEDAARAVERDRRAKGKKTGWLDSHPAPFVRATYLDRSEEFAGVEGEDRRDRYALAMRPFLTDFFDDQLQRNDFAASEYIVEEMAAGNWDADLLLLRGELYRNRGEPADLATAIEAYSQAIELGNTDPRTWRGLGLAHMRAGARVQGQEALKTYLEMEPDAPDAPMMSMMIGVN